MGPVLGLVLMMVSVTLGAHELAPICTADGCNCSKMSRYWMKVTCSCGSGQVLEVKNNSLPGLLMELEVENCKEVSLQAAAFTKLRTVQAVRIHGVGRVLIRRYAFRNLSASHLFLEVSEVGSVVLESHSFEGSLTPLTALLSRCSHVIVQGSAFSWLIKFTAQDVAHLELLEHSFSLKAAAVGHHGPATVIRFQNVLVPVIPSFAFPSSAAEIDFVDSEVRDIHHDAFAAITLFTVVFQNTSVQTVDTMAFSARTLIYNLEVRDGRIRVLSSNAIQSAVSNLTLEHSTFSDVRPGAVNVTVAAVIIRGNVFDRVQRRGFVLQKWNKMCIENNTFLRLDASAFTNIFNRMVGVDHEFTFTHNVIVDSSSGGLSFGGFDSIMPLVAENRFGSSCHCGLEAWLRDLCSTVGEEELVTDGVLTSPAPDDWWTYFYNNSLCVVDQVFARCFNVQEGYMSMRNFTEQVCEAEQVVCESSEVVHDTAISSGDFIGGESGLERDKKILTMIFLVVVCSMTVIFMVSIVMWLRRKKACFVVRARAEKILSCFPLFSTGVTTAGSISRLSLHEYAEIQQQMQQQQQQQTVVPGLTEISQNEEVMDDEDIPLEDKATQTLPDELTQELLQSLREKLEDPDNYSEAKDMIEHLYDLIKVEERNSLERPSTSGSNAVQDTGYQQPIDVRTPAADQSDDNLYDIIQPASPKPSKRANGVKKQSVASPGTSRSTKTFSSTGTRAPSPDKLLPRSPTTNSAQYAEVKKAKTAALCEYMEPKDRQVHVYTELPGTNITTAPTLRSQTPLTFLKTLGENLLSKKNKRSGLAVCEYTEPTDARVHVYTELPTRSAQGFANRPLPSKPDQEADPGEGPSH